MPGIQEFSQQVRSIIDVIIRFVRARKREEASISFGALLILGGVYLSSGLEKAGLKEFFAWWHGEAIVRRLLIAAGIGFVLYGGYKIFRLVYVPPLPPGKDRPSAIKGPMAFTEADGELFRKLGRESELQKLLGLALDDQVLMIVVRGASGAGKTSLLRAGLKHILGDRAIFHYWEAVPTEPDKGLLRAIQEKWPEGVAKPASLDDLVNPTDALGRQSHVIVLDQFEQLRGSKKMFALLRRIVRESKPPHRITWVIAFREEFFSDWMKSIASEYERGFHPPLMFLGLFTVERAREVIGQLVNESNLKDSIEQSVINNLIEAATVEAEVSPVDIGIGLLVLAELHERQSGNTITIRDYQFAGGAEGLLTQYISRCLELFPKESQEAILKAMLALRDPETNQRLAEGLTVDELAAEAGAEARLLKTQLDRLSHRDTRLLETVAPADDSPVRYRLPHERLVPALYRLTGKLLAEVDQAKLKFQNAFQAWKTNDKRSAYLLKAKELKLVERYESQIPWGNDEQEKKSFLNRSKRHRQFIRAATITAALAFIVCGWFSLQLYQRAEDKKYLSDESGYPSELYDYQHQLKKLELTEPLNLDRFIWLSSDSIEELSLIAANSSNSIAGLASLSRCHSLKKLTLDLRYSQVSNFETLSKLSNLQQLTLDLSYSQANNLETLSKLSQLTTLEINYDGGQLNKLAPLSKLSNLAQLRLDFRRYDVSNWELLSKLGNVMRLEISLTPKQLNNLSELPKLKNLTGLIVDLMNDRQISNLKLPPNLSDLMKLEVFLTGSQLSILESSPSLKNRMQALFISSLRQLSNLEPLAQLSNLTQLRFDLFDSQLSNLDPLPKLNYLKKLSFNLFDGQLSNLDELTKLSNLTELQLGIKSFREPSTQTKKVSDLNALTKLSNLTELSLDFNKIQISNLDELTKLSNWTQLELGLTDSEVSNLDLLSKLGNLTQLTLSLYESQVSDLEPVTKLTHLQSLSIENVTRAQRQSLRKIPASLVELKF